MKALKKVYKPNAPFKNEYETQPLHDYLADHLMDRREKPKSKVILPKQRPKSKPPAKTYAEIEQLKKYPV